MALIFGNSNLNEMSSVQGVSKSAGHFHVLLLRIKPPAELEFYITIHVITDGGNSVQEEIDGLLFHFMYPGTESWIGNFAKHFIGIA